MKHVFDLSLRYKFPLWGSLLIVLAVSVVSAAMMLKAYQDLHRDVQTSAASLGHTLARTLFTPLLHDDVWRAFEQIHAAALAPDANNPVQAEAILVVDDQNQIVVSSIPDTLPMLARLESLGADYAALAAGLTQASVQDMDVFDLNQTSRLFFVLPIREESAEVGRLVLVYSKDVFLPRFYGLALAAVIIGVLVLAVLLPINWYWGRRMADPLVALAHDMGQLLQAAPQPRHYHYHWRDEVGQLFRAYEALSQQLRQKAVLERELLQAERLSAIGRLASGMAHEINNPLGGMLMAVDTLRSRGDSLPPAKTLNLLERGLKQIQDTVSALLVQTRGQQRPLNPQDLDDVHTLIQPQLLGKHQRIDWQVDWPAQPMPPAVACRQILINLLLNAIQAAPEGSRLRLLIQPCDGGVCMQVINPGLPIPAERMAHLFEPFQSGREGGHGLGLWVNYQIVHQLGGRISVLCEHGEVRFEVWLPEEET